ncbi:hypothetical protein BKA69DRAFT_1126477 [Paraphysoderma sedebokerense]|nr:hypothetical protein BKA69DRAFT_1126477 [Paraphysoderma sedebokerense]
MCDSIRWSNGLPYKRRGRKDINVKRVDDYFCPQCKKVFSRKYNMQRHVNMCHEVASVNEFQLSHEEVRRSRIQETGYEYTTSTLNSTQIAIQPDVPTPSDENVCDTELLESVLNETRTLTNTETESNNFLDDEQPLRSQDGDNLEEINFELLPDSRKLNVMWGVLKDVAQCMKVTRGKLNQIVNHPDCSPLILTNFQKTLIRDLATKLYYDPNIASCPDRSTVVDLINTHGGTSLRSLVNRNAVVAKEVARIYLKHFRDLRYAEKNRVKKATLEMAVSIYDRIPDLQQRKHRFLILKYLLKVAEHKSDKWDMWADSNEGFDAHKVYLQNSDSLESRQHYNGLFQWYSSTITAGRDSAFDVSVSAETTKEHEERKDVNFVDVI